MANQPKHNRTTHAKTPLAGSMPHSHARKTSVPTRSTSTGRSASSARSNRATHVTSTHTGSTRSASRAGSMRHAAPTRTATASAANAAATSGDRPSIANENTGGLLSRRNFLYGAVGAGAIAVAAGGGAAVYFASQDGDTSLEYLEVSEDAVSTLNDFTLIEDSSTRMSLYGDVELPLGSLVWCNSDEVAACLLPTETGSPLAQVALLMLGSATYNIVLEKAVGASEGFEIYDVRASSKGAIWTEANILDGIWRIYTASLNSGTLGTPSLADQGDSEYETPSITIVDEYCFWQKQASVSNDSDNPPTTQILRVKAGSSDNDSLFESSRRMSTPIYGADDSIVITPRSKLGRSYTCVAKIDAFSGEIVDGFTLPRSMSPFEVGGGDTGLMFSFENIYSYGDGIANLGTYIPMSKPSVAKFSYSDSPETSDSSNNTLPYDNTANYSASKWFRFSRTPTAAPAFCGDYLIVKSSYAICGIDLDAKEYFTLDVDNGADDYGEYLATSGSHNTLVTYTSIDYTPVNDETQQLCRVKIWKPLSVSRTTATTAANNSEASPDPADDSAGDSANESANNSASGE